MQEHNDDYGGVSYMSACGWRAIPGNIFYIMIHSKTVELHCDARLLLRRRRSISVYHNVDCPDNVRSEYYPGNGLLRR